MTHETRAAAGIELRVESGRPPRLVGYASVFNSRSVDLGGFVEIVRPGAFKRSLATADVRALVDHDTRLIIGRNKAGTLEIGEDERGLKVEIVPPDTQAGRDVVESVRRGDLDGMSFAFNTPRGGDTWDFENKPPLRSLVDVDLVEVSVVAWPAYPRTEVALRSLTAAIDEARQMAAQRDAKVRRLAEIEADLKRRS